MKSEFREWFQAQHGKRPGGGTSDEVLRAQVSRGRSAADLLAARAEWDARWQSALYAWQARDGTRGDLVEIEWKDPYCDWPWYYVLEEKGDRLRLKGADYPDGSATHDGGVFWVERSEIRTMRRAADQAETLNYACLTEEQKAMWGNETK